MSRGRRVPTPDELRLWAEVAKTAAPLGGRLPLKVQAEPTPAAKQRPSPSIPVAPRQTNRRTTATALAIIDRRTVSRLVKGAVEIDARLDLHGMTQVAAHGRLIRFLKQVQFDDARLVLIITGKGRPGLEWGGGEERGVLRRAVPLWLAAAEMRPLVVGFGEAAPRHGGGGALYVRIRRLKG
jgi:DNA-nicking Smr family endonuclease